MEEIDKIGITVLAIIVILCIIVILWEPRRDKIIFVSSESVGTAQTAQFLPAGFKTQKTTFEMR